MLENLRVCGDIPYDGNYNCCHCEKCVRTMLQLWSIRKLEQSSAFHLPLTPQIILSTLITREGLKDYYRQSLDFAKKNKIKDNDILIAIETSLARPLWLSNFLTKYRRKKKHVIRNLRKIFHKAFSENINISKPK